MMNSARLKSQICAFLDEMSDLIIGLSQEIHSNPELSFQEYNAVKSICERMKNAGFEIEQNIAGLKTAFRAIHTTQSTGPTIAFLAEYDALPQLGHACGHNIITGIAVGAALGMAKLKDQLPGKLQLIGCPAEESGGGKIKMLEKGVFEGVDIALMVHPGNENAGTYKTLTLVPLEITFSGKSSHASVAPEQGVNALSAVIQTFNSVNALREHLPSYASVHGIITKGGERTNMVPDLAQCRYSIRAPDGKFRDELVKKVKNCARGAVLATGCKVRFGYFDLNYEPMRINAPLEKAFLDNLECLCLKVERKSGHEMGSTDAANVSQVVPLLHGRIAIAPAETKAHTEEFTKAASSAQGMRAMINAAKALAMTAIDVFSSENLFNQIKNRFLKGKGGDSSPEA